MKRRLLIILLLLVGGAIVNVAVAWGCAVYVSERSPAIDYPDEVPARVKGLVPSQWTTLRPEATGLSLSFRQLDAPGIQTIQFGVRQRIPLADGIGPTQVVHIQSAGWPMLALTCHAQIEGPHGIRWHGGRAIPEAFRPPKVPLFLFYDYRRPLPSAPLWPGFAINTVFYALGGWLLFAGPFVLRRRRRIRRGLCPKCAYDLRGSADTEKCPECGSIVAS